MKANEKTILRFLESSDTKFIIPIYQRKYSWGIEENKKLYDDLVNLIRNNDNFHFFGSIVSIYNDLGRDREYLIIDGQQRLTSISLLLIALYKLINAKVIDAKEINEEKIINQYIINQYSLDDDKLKLKLKKDDFDIYNSIYEGEEIEEITKISISYNYFYNRILKKEITARELLDAINSLSIVEIELKASEDKPQLIFESLNSTGKNLTEGDKIRNFIFMNRSLKSQNALYKKYWKIIEINTGDSINNFIRDYLMIKLKKIIQFEKLYITFKELVEISTEIVIEDILKEMVIVSKGYRQIQQGSNINEVNELLENIKTIGGDISNILILQLLNDYNNKNINKIYLVEILKILESYLFRRMICKISNKSLYKLFLNIINYIKENDDYKENYVELFKFILLKQIDSLRFPRNIEFKQAFFENDIYRLSTEKKLYIFSELENYDNKEILDIKNLIKSNVLTIEHVMPQKLNDEWKREISGNIEEVHTRYLHTIGNLTLTAYNANMSNRSFYEKKTIEKGFMQSRLKLNKFIAKQDKWTEKEIIERALILYNDALKIWKPIKSIYKLSKNKKTLYYLNDEEDLNNRKVSGMIFEGIQYNIKTFKELYDTMINILYDIEPLLLKKLVRNSINIDGLSFKLSDNKEFIMNSYKILDCIYSDMNLSNMQRLEILKILFEFYDIELSELSYYIE
ncbi:MAG: DUF262 domain-containing protein [Sarcina sp.]